MGTNRPGRRRPRREAAAAAPGRTGWRATIDSYGGFTVIVPIALAVIVIAVIVFRTPLGFSSSDDPLLGEPVSFATSTHVADGTLGPNPPLTPAGGPHYSTPLRQGVYERPVLDGNAIHSLEHGMIWITYQPDALDGSTLDALEGIASDFGRDVILSPRLENASPIIVVSWGRRLTMDALDDQLVRDFVTTNRNRSPEPGLR